jgi:hypothetical protein
MAFSVHQTHKFKGSESNGTKLSRISMEKQRQ